MEIKVNIPQNEYKQPTEVRAEVVQAICEAFIKKTCGSTFHPYAGSNNGSRNATLWLFKQNGSGYAPSFTTHEYAHRDAQESEKKGKEYIMYRIRGCEMKAAFDALQKAGYYMFRCYHYGSWLGYDCGTKPEMMLGTQHCERVTSFNDFID